VKLFLIAAALNTFVTRRSDAHGKDDMWRALLRAAGTWEVLIGEQRPGFFCSEMVAHAFDRDFTTDQFNPLHEPPSEMMALRFQGALEDLEEWGKLAADTARALPELRELKRNAPRVIDLVRALESIREH